MPFNGSGTYAAPIADNPVVTGTTVDATHFNNTISDIASALSNCITKDAQTVVTVPITLDDVTLVDLHATGVVDLDSTLNVDGVITNPQVFSTGDVKLTIKTTVDTGWVLMNDTTIGDATSGATGRAHADTAALFALLWNNTIDANCAVSTGRGASAVLDFAAHKTIALPKALGRALACYGTGSGLTARAMAKIIGEETHVLTTSEMPGHVHVQTADNNATTTQGNEPKGVSDSSGNTTTGASTASTGGDGAHNNMQPTLFLNVMIKL